MPKILEFAYETEDCSLGAVHHQDDDVRVTNGYLTPLKWYREAMRLMRLRRHLMAVLFVANKYDGECELFVSYMRHVIANQPPLKSDEEANMLMITLSERYPNVIRLLLGIVRDAHHGDINDYDVPGCVRQICGQHHPRIKDLNLFLGLGNCYMF